jgi:ABC-type multidrug transport system ATPase subunit
MNSTIIKFENIYSSYGSTKVLKDLSFTIKKGDITGFLGPNGAGKTTAFNIIAGLLAPDSGKVGILGLDPLKDSVKLSSKIGYLPENPPLYPEMRVKEYLEFIMNLRGVRPETRKSALEKALEKTGLEKRRSQIIGTLSKGFKQRVGLAQAIIHDPGILLLDEPAGGLDPVQTIDLIRRIGEMAGEYTLLFSSHDLTMASRVCKNYIILFEGMLKARGLVWKYIFIFKSTNPAAPHAETLKEMISKTVKAKILKLACNEEQTSNRQSEQQSRQTSNRQSEQQSRQQSEKTFELILSAEYDIRPQMVKFLVQREFLVYNVSRQEISMEKIFETLSNYYDRSLN